MRASAGLIGLVALALAGCASPPGATSSAEVAVKVLSVDEFHALVASHKGKVVVVDCWSTT